jgi:endonuclease/exonuclease/phosphatase (EEP) superfamily protein YafD
LGYVGQPHESTWDSAGQTRVALTDRGPTLRAVPHGGNRASVIDLVSWLIVAFVGLVTITQAFGWSGTAVVAVVQSLTPYLAIALVPVMVVALLRRRLLIVTVASSVGFGLGVLTAPLAFPGPHVSAVADSSGLRVASLNLYYENPEINAVADVLAAVDADVILFTEYTIEHQAALEASSVADRYPYRTERTGSGVRGIAVWSRLPIDDKGRLVEVVDSIELDVEGLDGVIRIIGMHLPTPVSDFTAWRDELDDAAEIGRSAERPTLLIGDLNSSYWHPPFRELLDAGFVDAHTADGSGFSTSWPTNSWIPPFVRLDHALTTGGLVSTDVADFDVPGSDHRGLVVTVAPAR